jgi:hypothetical protein
MLKKQQSGNTMYKEDDPVQTQKSSKDYIEIMKMEIKEVQ